MIITAINPSTDNLERTFLAQSYNSLVSSVQVKSNLQFANNNRVLIGEMGLSQSEVVTAGTPVVDGTTMPISATLYSHPADTPIYQLQYDQVQFFRSTNGISGNYVLLATVSLDVTNANLVTEYNDNTAQAGYYYKVAMYNSVTLVISTLGDPMPAVTGWPTNTVGYTIDQFYREISDPTESLIGRDELFGYFNEVNDNLLTNVGRPYRFLYTQAVFDRIANQNYLTLPVNSDGTQQVWKFDKIDYRFVDNTTNPITDTTNTIEILDFEYFRNRYNNNLINSTTVDDVIQAAALNDSTNAIDYYPASETTSTYGCFYLYYWQYFNRLNTEGQIWQTWNGRIYLYFALYRFYRKRSIAEPAYLNLADRYFADYNNELNGYKKHDRRDRGTPRSFSRENSVTRSFRRN